MINKNYLKIAIISILIISVALIINKYNYNNINSLEINKKSIDNNNLNTIAMYVDGEPTDTMPGAGYEIDQESSYCYTTDPNQHENVTLSTDSEGNLVIGNLKKGSKCFFYFQKVKSPSEKTLGMLEKASEKNFEVEELTEVTKDETETTGKVYSYSENGGTTYVFRGAPTDNWAIFGKEGDNYIWWRIVRINSDGTLRMIYTGTSSSTTTPPTDSTATQTVNASAIAVTGIIYNTSYNHNTYVGYYYGLESSDYTQTHSNTNPSTIATAVETWYDGTNLSTHLDKLSGHTGWCNDRTVVPDTSYAGDGTGTSKTHYGARSRLTNDGGSKSPVKPSLTCSKNDLYTLSTDAGSGNGALDTPVGLISADEVALAGMLFNYTGEVTANYMHVGENYWTMSPSHFNGSDANALSVNYYGYIQIDCMNDRRGVRPVINVIPDDTFTGKGTYQDPYIFA